MKKLGTVIAAVTVIPVMAFGIIKGIRSLGKISKGTETDFSEVGKSAGKSVGRTIDAIIMKYNDIVDTVQNNDGKGEGEIDQALEMAKRELDKAAQSAKKALAGHA